MRCEVFITSSAAFSTYPLLRSFTTGELRARFMLLAAANALLRDLWPLLLTADAGSPRSISRTLGSLRAVWFPDVKLDVVHTVMAASGLAVAAQRPRVSVNRLRAASATSLRDTVFGQAERQLAAVRPRLLRQVRVTFCS
jgi:hypothetical protein